MDSSNIHASCRRYTNDIDDKFRPRTVTLVKDKNGFGFTLRHFIVYPPTRFSSAKGTQDNSEDPSLSFAQWKSDYKNKPMDTIFIREVKEGSPAHNAGLNKGDRIIAINNHPLTGKSYADIIHLILKSGQRLRLLVVPKEDDILQLYFASSAYQPVHREGKQHKYLVPSFPSDTGQSNHLYRQSSYGTYPGRVLNKVKASANKTAENPKQSSQCMYLDPNFAHSTNEDSNLHSTLQVVQDLERKGYDLPLPEKELYEGGCFSEDEGLYHHKELRNNELCNLQPPKLKDTVANFYYSLCHDQPTSVLSFSSEENLNYPIYMSDFDDIVHCDNMEDSRNNPDSLHGTDGAILPNPNRYPYQCDRPRYSGGNQACDRISDSSCLCVSDLQTPSYWTSNKMSNTKDISQEFSTDHSLNHSATMCHHSGESNSLFCDDFSFTNNQETPSINLVAQRRHQFESGNLLAESMERMKLYRSELSRMSKPNQARIVSSRAAEFENKSQMSVLSPTRNHKQEDSTDKLSEATLHEEKYAQNEQSDKYVYNLSLDHQNSNKMQPEDSVHESDPNIYANVTAEEELTPGGPGVVHRRKTVPVSSDQDECHIVRRISYLRATANERMNVESDLSEEDETSDASSPNKEYRIQKLKSFFGEKTPKVKQALVPVEGNDTDVSCSHEPQEEQQKSVYGWVICKVVSLEGKRSSDRSWRHLWAILRNNILYLLKERREPSKGTLTGDEHVINVKYSIAKVANDYVKRKHVLRLMLLNGTEYLVQTESHTSMMEWLKALQIFAREIAELPEWLKNTSVLEKAAAYEQQIQTHKKSSSQQHPMKKLVFRHRSPSEHSPTVKTRRASQGDELALTKIGVLWRDRMVQGWKKVHGTNSQIPKDASFGVRLENAPPGVTNEHVPLIVELCVQIVETRGLDVVGIYRVPGNNASVSVLTDMVNQGIDDVVLKDGRWNDVNIVSSLLKAFFRKLPEPLLTSYLYPKFIQASKIDDPVKRLKAIKYVLYQLPVHYFATLRYLMYHLKKVVEHSDTNKMEARNLAIVFGPTLVRTTDNNMVTMVTDMSHQCYLIETMIVYAEWLFEDCGELIPLEVNAQDKRKTHPPSTMQSNALLGNLNKLDENTLDSLPHEMFTSFYNTATRHLRHRQKRKDASQNAKKRSGIIADDADILINENMQNSLPENFLSSNNTEANQAEPENLSDISFGSCSSLISGSSKTKQRSLSKERQPRNGSLPCEITSPGLDSEAGASSRVANLEEDIVHHRYNELSALAQEKIKNFEQETKALLRRDVQKPRVSIGTPQVEWEQIEREWQKAKLELEQEDLLDYLADDPSYLSCLLNRGEGMMDLSPAADMNGSVSGKNELPVSSSSCSMSEYLSYEPLRTSATRTPETCFSQSDKSVFKQRIHYSPSQPNDESRRTKSDNIEISTSVSQPVLNSLLLEPTGNALNTNKLSQSSVPSKFVSSENLKSQKEPEPVTQNVDPDCDKVTFPYESAADRPPSSSS